MMDYSINYKNQQQSTLLQNQLSTNKSNVSNAALSYRDCGRYAFRLKLIHWPKMAHPHNIKLYLVERLYRGAMNLREFCSARDIRCTSPGANAFHKIQRYIMPRASVTHFFEVFK